MPKYRSLKTGRFVSEYYAKRHQTTTEEVKREERDLVQIRNPRTGTYTMVDRTGGEIVGHVEEPLEGVRVRR
jgi:hypothetical protein